MNQKYAMTIVFLLSELNFTDPPLTLYDTHHWGKTLVFDMDIMHSP